jgi:hypothetical protein
MPEHRFQKPKHCFQMPELPFQMPKVLITTFNLTSQTGSVCLPVFAVEQYSGLACLSHAEYTPTLPERINDCLIGCPWYNNALYACICPS